MSQSNPQSPPGPKLVERFRQRIRGDRWFRLAVAAGVILLVAAPFAAYWVVFRFTHSITDDAFVETHVVNIAPQEVSGHLVRYLVQEQDVVAAGQLLAEI